MKNKTLITTIIIVIIVIVAAVIYLFYKNSNKQSATGNTTSNIATEDESPTDDNITATSADGSVSLSVPSTWNANDTSIWPTANLGVSNADSHEYVIIIKKPKSAYAAGLTVDQFIAGAKPVYEALLTSPVWGQSSPSILGGLDGKEISLNGTSKKSGESLQYWINVVEDSSNFYQVVGYTYAIQVDANQSTIEDILNSFKVRS